MKTERLYYNDPYLVEFDARVVDAIDAAGGSGLILDRTAFYPTSGGQPNDLGTLGGTRVVDVYEDEKSGAVVHVVHEPIALGPVHGSVDAARRRDHIQQHSGQHVLSRAFVQLFGLETAGDAVSPGQLSEAEEAANQAVLENKPVKVCYIPPESAAGAGLRKASERMDEIRVIDIEGFDRSACGVRTSA